MSISRRKILKGFALGIPALQLGPTLAFGKNSKPGNENTIDRIILLARAHLQRQGLH